jgi:hypothetical protein
MTGFGSRIADFSRTPYGRPGIGCDDLEPGHLRVPACIALRMLRRDARGDAVRAANTIGAAICPPDI